MPWAEQGRLEEIYHVEVSPSLISEVTEGVMELARTWQNRPLDPFYADVLGFWTSPNEGTKFWMNVLT